MKNKTQNILSRWYVLIVLAVALAVAIYVSFYLYSSSRDSINKQLVSRAETMAAAFSLNEEKMATFTFTDADIEKPEYTGLKQTLMHLHQINNDSRFVYFFAKKENDVVFVVDSEDPSSEDYSPPGQVYFEASDRLRAVFDNGKTIIEGPSKDRWGTWVSALAPVVDKDGKVAFVLGIDISAKDYTITPIIYAAFPAASMLILLILIAMGLYFRKREVSILNLKSQLVSIASHELRAPLTGIRWSTETLLGDASVPESAKSILGNVRSVCLDLIEIVNQLLDLTVIESGIKQIEDSKIFALSEALDASLSDQKLAADQKKIKIISLNSAKDVAIKGNIARMKTLMNNLVANSIKYSTDGSTIELKVEAKRGRVYLDIIDEGIGVPEGELALITKGFFRATNAKAKNISGTGLGLHLCVKIVESFNGKIFIRSKEGVGTVISIEFPVTKEALK